MHQRLLRSISIAIGIALIAVLAACGGDEAGGTAETQGIRVVSPQTGADILADPPTDLVVLDVRTPEEFADGHIDGAIMIDFYEADFADQIAALDPDKPYLLYCRSGNRSGQTRVMMESLGFADVADVNGGIVAWSDSGLPVSG